MKALSEKLGFIDLREFIALNKFLIENDDHQNILSKFKKDFLAMAIKNVEKTKKIDFENKFRVSDVYVGNQ